MRIAASIIALAVVAVIPAPALAQTSAAPSLDRVRFDAAGGMSRYGPHAFGGLEVAMNRWLAIRGEGLFALHSREDWPAYRMTAASLSGVLSHRPEARLSPYVFGGVALTASQGFQLGAGPIGGGGLRFRFGRVQPFVEVRKQHPIGVPVSLGIRF